jgi:hypothetical protein
MKSLIIFLLMLMLTGVVMAQDDNDYYGNPPKYPPPFVQQDLDSSHPVVPKPDLDDRPTPGILDDSVTVNTTVPDEDFGVDNNQEYSDQQELEAIPQGVGSDLLDIEKFWLKQQVGFYAEVSKAELKDVTHYLPIIQNNRTSLWEDIDQRFLNQIPKSNHMWQPLYNFVISQNERLDKFIYQHFLLEDPIELAKTGLTYFDQPDSREMSKRGLIKNQLIISHYEGLGLEYTYRNVGSMVKEFDLEVFIGYCRANQEANGNAYLNECSTQKYMEETLDKTDGLIKELGFTFSSDNANGAQYLLEPIKQASSETSSIVTTQPTSHNTTSPVSSDNFDPLAGSGFSYVNKQGTPQPFSETAEQPLSGNDQKKTNDPSAKYDLTPTPSPIPEPPQIPGNQTIPK